MSQKTPAPNAGPVTADDVAALAGVSRWTVTRAFKKGASVSHKTRERVMQAADELGYVPDLLAASLASDRSNLIALVIDDFANPHKLVMLENLTRILRANGWDTLLVNTLNRDDASAALLNASQRRVDAAVLLGVNFNDAVLATALGARRVGKLIIFARYSENPDTISICCLDETAMQRIFDHVLARGYKRPYFLAGPQTRSAHLLRKETFMKRWRAETGYTPESASMEAYDSLQSYAHVTKQFKGKSKEELPDVIVCENDALAMGTIDAIRFELGLRVPQDIAVTGFDDVPQGQSPHYDLTTYNQPIAAMAEGLVAFLKGEVEAEQLSQFTGELVVRSSA